jgi:soluble lytic murein transglycosylase-like protein
MSGIRGAWLAGVIVATVVVAGCGLGGAGKKENQALPYSVVSEQPAPTETTPESPPTTAAPKPTPKPSRTSAAPTEEPFQLPACAHYEGKSKITRPQAAKALNAAAAKIYWPISDPTIKLSARLVRAVAWQESGWQTNIVNCDGGYGLMQLSPSTVEHINTEFVKTYDPKDYQQNATLGANYLAWLTRYFAYKYFKGSFDLSPKKCATHSSMCLLNLVLSGYNAGFGAVDAGWAAKALPNPDYVDSVRSLMEHCSCDNY